MFAQPERPSAVHGNDFVNRVAEQECAVERRDLGVGEQRVTAVQVADRQRPAHKNHNRMVSISRRHQLPEATLLSGWTGMVASV